MTDNAPDYDYDAQGADGSEPTVRFACCPKCHNNVVVHGPDTPSACTFCGSNVKMRTRLDSHHADAEA